MRILNHSENPFIPKLFGTRQTETELKFRMEFVRGCDLMSVMNLVRPYYQFYAAEVICALKLIHKESIVYRDLKPEHIIIDQTGHTKIVDFGFAK